ncbi:mechanosensitive ion channel [Halobacteriovorax sp. GB3]|uniref:mechanosensitive ion channel family protein n=1 Tax=Halobacteriovorax sp. GB3 TaxID=2719615 RepID=UPI00235F1E0D|nr:mechanosensitive ion channel domain-containing protein [Halobacteriovorax sp. GB3]MDD0854155.1 mechanosensitive ion channel [Halobacteriovorax sp. GB3]
MEIKILDYIYPLSITFTFFLIYFLAISKIKRIERKRMKTIDRKNIEDAVETDSPVDDQEQYIKDIGQESAETRFTFLKNALPVILIMMWAIFISVPFLGKVPTVYVSIFTAIISVLVGIALRPFLENLFAGVVITFFKSIRVGDTVIIDDEYGLIEEVTLTYSVLKRWDWNRIVIPNSKMLQKEIKNLTLSDRFIWAHVEFFIHPRTDIDHIKKIAIQAAKKSPYFNKTEEPSFWVMDLHKDSVRCWIAAWANSPSDAWELKSDIRYSLTKELAGTGIYFHSNYYEKVGDDLAVPFIKEG